jgi:hypothetical protein
MDRGIENFPIAAADNLLYQHESGIDADGETLDSFIESSPIDVADGNNFMFISRILPDVSFGNSTAVNPSVAMSVKMQNAMGGDIAQSNSKLVTQTNTSPVEQFTEQVYMRLRGRSMRFRVESDEFGVTWRLGSPTIDIRTDGRR